MTTDSVFASLSELPTRQFTEVTYQLLILLRHRALLHQLTEKEILEPVQSHGIVATNPALWRKIAHTLRKIEASEGQAIADISDTALLKYRKALDQLLAIKAPRTPSSTGASGQLVLDLLREDPDLRAQAGTTMVSASPRTARKALVPRKIRRTAPTAQNKTRKPATPIAEIA